MHGFDDLCLHSCLHTIRWKMLNRKVSYCLPTGAEYRCRWMPTLAHSNLDTHRSSPAPGYRLSIGSRCRPMARLHPAWPIAGRTAGQCPDWGLRGGLSIYLYLLFTEVWGVVADLNVRLCIVYILDIFCFTSQVFFAIKSHLSDSLRILNTIL